MTYDVFGGTLNPTVLHYQQRHNVVFNGVDILKRVVDMSLVLKSCVSYIFAVSSRLIRNFQMHSPDGATGTCYNCYNIICCHVDGV